MINIEDKELEVVILFKMAQCYHNLGLYEDALEYCNVTLSIDQDNVMSLELKAKSLAYLLEFDRSRAIFELINFDLDWLHELQAQANGDYQQVLKDPKLFLAEGRVLNYIDGVEIKMTKNKGRGAFATKSMEKGDLIIVEKAIAESHQYSDTSLSN